MRKLLMLMLVLGVASGAYAGFSISVHTTTGGTYDGSPLASSDELWLDIDATSVTPGEYTGWALVVDDTQGLIRGGAVSATGTPTGDLNFVDVYYAPATGYNYIDNYWVAAGAFGANMDGTSGGVFDIDGDTLSGVQIDQILFHCEDAVDATVELWLSADGVSFSLADTVVISQIPEPFTMALLGLGGLFLRRRK